MTQKLTQYRPIASGMGQAVAERTILRKKENGEFENWGEVADRVALGNSLLFEGPIHSSKSEYELLRRHIANGNTLMSGRHLQHGDSDQPNRNLEIFTNCSTSATSFLLFYLLLNGSGVGRCYDDDMIVVNWDNAPNLRCVLDSSHPDFNYSAHESLRDAQHKYGFGKDTMWFEIPDSREGWAKALELWENAAFEKIHSNKMLILDFSKVRPKGSPINGMQKRPASGPVALIDAFNKAASLKGSGLAPWKQAIYLDHYFAECVLVGGARRAARMSTKQWTDISILDFITIKRPIEFNNKSVEEIKELRKNSNLYGFLWSSNNSITVDEEFWKYVDDLSIDTDLAKHARKVFELSTSSAYGDGTGEPGFINSDRLVSKDEGWNDLNRGDYVGSKKYQINDDTQILFSKLAKRAKKKKYHYIVNPCVTGETNILTKTGYRNIVNTIGEKIEIWNGIQWSEVTPFHTGINPIMKVTLDDGTSVRCTPYHKFILKNGERVDAQDLEIGMSFKKFDMPVIELGEIYSEDGYSQGFYSGDGNTDLNYSWLYDTKFCCMTRLVGKFGNIHSSSPNRLTWTHGPMKDKTWVPVNGTKDYCLAWFAGLCDSDGCVTRDKNGNGIQIVSIDKQFLNNVRLMLTRLGIVSKVVSGHEERNTTIKNVSYHCQTTYRLLIGNEATYRLTLIGLKTERLKIHNNPPQRNAQRFVNVLNVEDENISEDTYCFTDHLNNSGTFNGIVTGNCGEIVLNSLGAYCTIADVVPYHCDTLEDAEECFAVVTRSLMRVNMMDSLYSKEVNRTNRIGVGITGIHEFAYKFFGFGFYDLIDEEKSKSFWLTLSRFNRIVFETAVAFAKETGTKVPHTLTTIKPAGTTSKLFLLTEGWHLPSMRKFLRWVQFRTDDPLVKVYQDAGYPSKELVSYTGTTIVGFPTEPVITTLGMEDKLVTASEATPEEQFKWLMLGEKYWIHGTDEFGEPNKESYGNQISYTLKYKPELVDYSHFKQMLQKYQSQIRCCSVMPQEDKSSYEYLPEQSISSEEYEKIVDLIKSANQLLTTEEVGREHIECAGGICPVDFNSETK